MISKYNIRVYGLWIRDNRILLCDEEAGGMAFTKFPGGGLEFGEGLADALKREVREELDIEVAGMTHFYTTDVFQQSAFNPSEQLISVYYTITSHDELKQYTVVEYRNGRPFEMHFRWAHLDDFSEHDVTFPIDKMVAQMITGSR